MDTITLIRLFMLLGIMTSLAAYFVPVIVAFTRNHEQRNFILLLNLLLGWTVLGWIAALIWASTSPAPAVAPKAQAS